MQKPAPPVAPKPNRSSSIHTPVSSRPIDSVNDDSSSTRTNTTPSDQEAQLNQLTNMLVYNLNQAATEPDFFGMCSRCHGVIKGADNGCTAMDKFYHSSCFTCEHCGRALSGHTFYAVKEQAICEGCYVNTLEKCTACSQPVTERILRATGKAYHPECFTCTHCKKSLDGQPFTVDSHNQIHCIEDFHMKYAPRCSVCTQPIIPEKDGCETVRIVALDRNFHLNCYKCEDCGVILSSNQSASGCFPLEGHILCRSCNRQRAAQLNPEVANQPLPQPLSLPEDL